MERWIYYLCVLKQPFSIVGQWTDKDFQVVSKGSANWEYFVLLFFAAILQEVLNCFLLQFYFLIRVKTWRKETGLYIYIFW
jgi:hypothetical protein